MKQLNTQKPRFSLEFERNNICVLMRNYIEYSGNFYLKQKKLKIFECVHFSTAVFTLEVSTQFLCLKKIINKSNNVRLKC